MDRPENESQAHSRLVILNREIASAEAKLLDLMASIEAARGHAGLLALQAALDENVVLREANRLAGQETQSAFAALEVAVKASQTDALTGLKNRVGLWDRLDHEIQVAKRNGTFIAVYFLDLNRFKAVNDQLGHDVGDQLLQHVAQHLLHSVRASDTVCRWGGDEFIVICQFARAEDVALTRAKFQTALDEPLVLADGGRLHCSVSIGVSVYPTDAQTPTTLIQRADAAMYAAKRLQAPPALPQDRPGPMLP